MEYLTRLLSRAALSPRFRYHPGCQKEAIISLCFADDLLLFSKGNEGAVQCLLDAFCEFSNATGLVANVAKSNIYFGGVSPPVQQKLLAMSGFRRGTFPMRYLGIPLAPKKWSKVECNAVVGKITELIQCWLAKHLSYAGRLTLVQSVLQAISSYWATFFVLPSSVCQEIDRKCREFLWGASPEKKKTPLLNWSVVCSPKS